MSKIFIFNERDNIGVAIVDINPYETINLETINKSITIQEKIPFGFKVSIKKIKKGENIIKYGEVIGKATKNILSGELVHIHNVEGVRGRGDL